MSSRWLITFFSALFSYSSILSQLSFGDFTNTIENSLLPRIHIGLELSLDSQSGFQNMIRDF